jgi:hypothetical protein
MSLLLKVQRLLFPKFRTLLSYNASEIFSTIVTDKIVSFIDQIDRADDYETVIRRC